MTSRLSRSGARIRGDEYQHLFAWIQVVEAVLNNDTIKVGIEDPKAGNADDVTVYKDDGAREYYQVKSAVDARNPIDVEWLTKPSRSGGPSVLQGFYELWAGEPDDKKPKITLMTNRLPSHTDTLLATMDGRDGTVVRSLESARPGSKLGRIRRMLADHLKVTEEEEVRFFRDLRFKLGITHDSWMKTARYCMLAAGLCYDNDAISQGIGIVRHWVTSGKRKITRDELQRAVEPLKLVEDPPASLLVQAIDHDPMPDAATVSLDWVGSFPGSEPRVRRQPSDPALWNGQFRPQLKQAARRLQGHAHVLVRGYMRLPTWFAAGVELGKTAGFQVSSLQGHTAWSSEGSPSDGAVVHAVEILGPGGDLAVGIALSSDLSPDVLEYLASQQVNAGKYVSIYPVNGASNQSVSGAAEARGYAYTIRDLVRILVREHKPDQVHLFLSAPNGVVLLLGHLWDRMPPTQLYEDLGMVGGYAPSYLIPN